MSKTEDHSTGRTIAFTKDETPGVLIAGSGELPAGEDVDLSDHFRDDWTLEITMADGITHTITKDSAINGTFMRLTYTDATAGDPDA